MLKSSRPLVSAACTLALLVGIGVGAVSAQTIVIEKAMPAPIVEVVPARPSPAHTWVKGHHVFEEGRWVWHPGLWIRL